MPGVRAILAAVLLWVLPAAPPRAGVVDHDAIRRERLDRLLPEAMTSHGVDLWLTFTRENTTDPLLPVLGLDHIVARGAFVFALGPDGGLRKVAIAASYDVEPIEHGGLFDRVIAYKKEGIKPHLATLVKELDPRRIAVNVSRDVAVADGLTAGMRAYLEEALGPYTKRFTSSEKLVVSLLGRKTPHEISALREAAEATQRIISEALSGDVIQPGVTTERALNDWMVARAKEGGYGVAFSSIVVGPARGHSDPTDRVIQRGDVLRFDWGATHGGYAADIQRTAYVLKDGESRAPAWLARLFEDNLAANRAAAAACKPGSTGNDVDRAGRDALTARGYEEYPHGTGHAIGLKVHDVGPMLGPDWRERYGDPVFFRIEAGGVFAIEPLIYVTPPELGYEINVALEEDVVVEESGSRYIGTPQTEVILAGGPRAPGPP